MADSTLWVNEGGVLHSPILSDLLRFSAQPLYKFRQFADAKQAFGKNKGDTFNWDKVADVGTIGGLAIETNTAPQSAQAITKGTLTVDEFMNSIPYTGKIDALSKFDIESMVRKGLANDMSKVLDSRVHSQFDQTLLRYVGTATAGSAVTTNGTATATNTSVLNEFHISKMDFELEKRNVPRLAGDTYVFIGSLDSIEGVRRDMVSINQYTETGYTKILNGEQGMLHGVRLVKDNNATRFTINLTNRTKVAKSWTGANSLEGFMFGQDTVVEAVAVPEEVRRKEVTDYGRSHGVAWYFLGEWKIVWDTEADQRIIKWASEES